MIRLIKRYFAIRSYALKLPDVLWRQFGLKRAYTIEEVSKAAQRGGFNTAFIAYAHSVFCDEKDFNAYYGPLGVACTYNGLRSVVARRYFRLFRGFDASTIVRAFRHQDGSFYESGLGEDSGGGHH